MSIPSRWLSRNRMLIALALAASSPGGAQSIDTRVDGRVEVVAALFRLAGRSEYNMTQVPRWSAAIDAHFAQFATHPAVQMTARLARQNRIGFFVPMNLAAHLGAAPELAERTPIDGTSSLHRAWATYPDSTRAYLELVRGFARAIVGVMKTDDAGLPIFDADFASTALHELNHPYVTPLVRRYLPELRSFSDSLYAPVAKQIREQSYGSWDAVLNEALVRAAVVRYHHQHRNTATAEQTIAEETRLGFVWTRELVDLLAEYERARATYPSMSEFMPRVVAFFRDLAPRVRTLVPPG